MVSLQPDSYRAHQMLGASYEARKRYDDALAEYRAALQAKPDLPGLHLAIAHVHLKNLRLEEAAAEYERELGINPLDPGANTELGGIFVNGDRPERAIALLERALRVRPDRIEARRRLGKAYYRLGLYAKAEAELKQAAAADDDGSTHYLLARTYRSLQRLKEADEALQMVTKIKAAKLQQALERAERVRHIDP